MATAALPPKGPQANTLQRRRTDMLDNMVASTF